MKKEFLFVLLIGLVCFLGFKAWAGSVTTSDGVHFIVTSDTGDSANMTMQDINQMVSEYQQKYQASQIQGLKDSQGYADSIGTQQQAINALEQYNANH